VHELRGWDVLERDGSNVFERMHELCCREGRKSRDVRGRWGFGLHKLSLRDLRGVGGIFELYVVSRAWPRCVEHQRVWNE
jgi:hypothetical protein